MAAPIYLDYQATTPLAPEAYTAMRPWLEAQHANPHSAHGPGRAAAAAVEAAREQVASLLPDGGRVVFTSGATEALNLAIKGFGPGRFIAPATEHAAVLDTADSLAKQGRSVSKLPVASDGILASATLDDSLGETPEHPPGLVAAMLVNNEIGVVQDVASVAEAAHAAGALMLTDAVQGYGRVAIPGNVDMVALSSHKIHGPKGIGALWVRDGIELDPLMHGGGQEQGIRSGTVSPALCAGFGAAAKLAGERFEKDAAHVAALWDIAGEAFSAWTVNGTTQRRYKGNLNIRRDGLDVSRLLSEVRSVAFSAGSACASGSGRPSHVLRALGLSAQQVKSSVRLGFGRYTSEQDLVAAARLINAAAADQLD